MSSERTKKPLASAAYPEQVASDSSRSGGPTPSANRTSVAAAAVQPTSYFAPALRAAQEEIETTIQLVAQSPVTTALLRSATSMMCILNEHRQIVAVNTAMLDSLDMTHADDVIGLRPGEAMRCIHKDDHPSGCGTGPFCRGCEAAVAIVASQSTSRPVERDCVISIMTRKGEARDVALSVRASPFELRGERFTVFCMTDIGAQKLFQDLEHSFLHDLSNLATALCASSALLRQAYPEQSHPVVDDLCELTQRLSRDITVQRLLISSDPGRHRPNWQKVAVATVLRSSQRLAGTHPSARNKRFAVESHPHVTEITTDGALLERVLTNMLLNAFEATGTNGEVRLLVESSDSTLRFSVHNPGYVPPAVAARVFHRHFTTKRGPGRGQGTYAIRLLGETLLQGKVGFSTDVEQGTDFHLEVPLTPDRSRRSLVPKR